jgi:leader peptidase (prepilin peptidase) / N-methyltransferase
MSVYVWPALLFTWLFCMGASIGSFLNVCIARLPTRRTPCWPGSHCFHCFQAIGLRDNIPLLSYWLLRGRCRNCGAPFSMRYFWIEFATGCLFAGYYLLDIGLNVHGYQQFGDWGLWYFRAALFPPWSWHLFIIHAVMLAFVLTAAMIQWEQGRAERSVVVRGCALGLLASMLFPWPFPNDWKQAVASGEQAVLATATGVDLGWLTPHPGPVPADSSWAANFYSPRLGFVPWPAFGPLNGWLSWGPVVGLTSGLAGCALGLALRQICCGGLFASASGGPFKHPYDDGGVLAIAGSYLGWQPILVGSVVAFVVTLLWRFAIRRKELPFGLLAGSSVFICWMPWTWLTSLLAPVCFDLTRSGIALGVVGLLAIGVRWVAITNAPAHSEPPA